MGCRSGGGPWPVPDPEPIFHRNKLGLSAADYGKLVGVSGLTIYNWESGKARPREQLLLKPAAVHGLGKREALRRLELLRAWPVSVRNRRAQAHHGPAP